MTMPHRSVAASTRWKHFKQAARELEEIAIGSNADGVQILTG